jgi:hypothetical protein
MTMLFHVLNIILREAIAINVISKFTCNQCDIGELKEINEPTKLYDQNYIAVLLRKVRINSFIKFLDLSSLVKIGLFHNLEHRETWKHLQAMLRYSL